MRLSISNIAWDPIHDEVMAGLLKAHGVDAIDVAPSKYFPRLADADPAEMESVRTWWSDHGIEITGMQALLFGTVGLNVFGSPQVQQALLEHLADVCRIGAALGARRLVFGSPKNRDRSGLSDEQARSTALDFFRRLGDIAAVQDVWICLEPNPPRYGANFMINSAETAAVVRAVNHHAIRMQFDAGAAAINGEDPESVLSSCADLIGHVHASEPELLPLGEGGADHLAVANALRRHMPEPPLVCIEMLSPKGEQPFASIERALAVASMSYRSEPAGFEP